jgi:DNA-binding transcriptional LysR family regulator
MIKGIAWWVIITYKRQNGAMGRWFPCKSTTAYNALKSKSPTKKYCISFPELLENKMEIKFLRAFLTIAREGSLTGAAKFLFVTQPTLSRMIKEMEAELGTKLFNRGSHSITLTDDGMYLRRRAEEIIDMVDKTSAAFTDREEAEINGEVYLGGGETFAMTYIAKVIEQIRISYPGIRYHLYSGNSDDVTERLEKGLLDFGLLIQPADLSKYEYITLPAKDTWGIVMRRDHVLSKKKWVTPKDLVNTPLIVSRQAMKQTLSRNEFTEWFGTNIENLNIIATINLINNATILVRQGVGCVFSLENLVYTGEENDLCFRPLKPRLQSDLNIVWKKFQVFSPAADVFLRYLKEEFSPN